MIAARFVQDAHGDPSPAPSLAVHPAPPPYDGSAAAALRVTAHPVPDDEPDDKPDDVMPVTPAQSPPRVTLLVAPGIRMVRL